MGWMGARLKLEGASSSSKFHRCNYSSSENQRPKKGTLAVAHQLAFSHANGEGGSGRKRLGWSANGNVI